MKGLGFAMWPRSITLRVSLAFAILSVSVFAVLGLYLGRAADTHMASLDSQELHSKLTLIRHMAARETSVGEFAARLNDLLAGEHGLLVRLDGPDGLLVEWPANSAMSPHWAGQVLSINRNEGNAQRFQVGAHDYRGIAGDMMTGWGQQVSVLVARDIHHHTAFLQELQQEFWFAVLAAAGLMVGLGSLIARHGMRPVKQMVQLAGSVSIGQLSERIPEAGVPLELRGLVQAFNAMLDRLEASFQRLSDFSADLAHELRTPIHRLRMQTEVSLSKPRQPEEYRELLAANLEAYEQLARIIADMLFLAKADHGLVIPQRREVDLTVLCQQLIEYYGVLAEGQKLQLIGAACVSGDEFMLQRAVGNLLANAIRHTPVDGQIRITLAEQPEIVGVQVSNTGRPIAVDGLRDIFKRFVRLDEGSEGNGLGLAITQSIVQAHGGTVSVTSDSQSTCFTIRLPK